MRFSINKILLFLFVMSFIKAEAQNGKHEFFRSDTSGVNWTYGFRIRNINVKNASKITFDIKVKDQRDKILIKEVSILPIGDYFMVGDGNKSRVIKSDFSTEISIAK